MTRWSEDESNYCATCGKSATEPRKIPGPTGPDFPAGGGPPETEGFACANCEATLCEDCYIKGEELCADCLKTKDEEDEENEEEESKR